MDLNLAQLFNMKQAAIQKYMLPLATAVGAWGGFPDPPRIVTETLFKHKWIQYLMLFVLIWQGGSNQDAMVAGVATAIMFIVKKALNYLEQRYM